MSVEDALQSITVLGSALGRRPQAESLEAKIRGELEQIKTARADKTPLRTLVVIGHDPGELRAIFAAAKGSYHDQLLEMVGGANVFDMRIGSYPNISKEILIQKNPQAILVLAPYASVKKQTDEQERRIWSSLGVIEAVKNGCVYLLTDDCVQQPGLRMPKAARLFAQKLDDCAAKME
jgi:ABC-type Fe3+-hydroxamate transport system substrate-binding protein